MHIKLLGMLLCGLAGRLAHPVRGARAGKRLAAAWCQIRGTAGLDDCRQGTGGECLRVSALHPEVGSRAIGTRSPRLVPCVAICDPDLSARCRRG